MSGSTKHGVLVDHLMGLIKSGELKPGDRLTSEPILADQLNVSYMTARKAVSHLVEQGILYRVRGRGTFVAEEPSTNRKPTLGLLLLSNWHSIDPFYFPPLVSGFVARAEEQGFQVHLANRSEPLLEMLELKELRVHAAACVLLDQEDIKDADALLDRGVAIVAINHYGGLRRVTSVSPDNRRGAVAATRALLDLGHRDIAFLHGPSYNLDATERRKGFEATVREHPDVVRSVIVDVPFTEEAGYDYATKLVKRGKLPTAIISSSDLSAIGCIKGLLDAGLRVPQDVSVVGFGDFRLSAYFHPALTTVRLPLNEIGRKAADALVRVYYGSAAEAIRIECPLIWRESATAPKKSSSSE